MQALGHVPYSLVPQTPGLADVMRSAMDARMANVYTSMPGQVVNYDPSTQTADIQPAVGQAYRDESGDRVPEALPIVPHVPVAFPRGGGFRIVFPLRPGDTVLLVFTNCSIDKWLARGGVVDPGDDRRNCLSDAVAYPGLFDFAHPLGDTPDDETMQIGMDQGPTIEISSTDVQIGGDKNLVTREEFLAHGHETVTSLGTPSGPAPATPPSSATLFPGTQILKGG